MSKIPNLTYELEYLTPYIVSAIKIVNYAVNRVKKHKDEIVELEKEKKMKLKKPSKHNYS